MTKFFFKSKNPIFGPFPQFWGKKRFSKKLDGHAQPHKGFRHHAKIQRNLMIQFQENTQTDVRRERWTNLLHKILPATARGLPVYLRQIGI